MWLTTYDAVMLHVRICAGGGPKGPSLPQPSAKLQKEFALP
jgi:hypothetical protein